MESKVSDAPPCFGSVEVRRPFKTIPAPHSLLCLLLLLSIGAGTGCSGVSANASKQAATSQIIVTISPTSAELGSGDSLQFSATVTGTSESGVTWSSTGGVITPAGLFKAPSVASAINITITALSLANPNSTAVGVVHVTPPPPSISTASLPPAVAEASYAAMLQGTGGEPPYRWDIVQGSLPAGLQLNASSGALSGTPSIVGESSFVVQLTDENGLSATQHLTLTVSAASGATCGPPTYACSRTDFAILIPTAPPQLGSNPSYYGGHSGAGMVAIDPAYGNRILRVTDGETDSSTPGMAFGTSWSAEANLISSDESLFFVTNEGQTPCLFQFDLAAFQASFHGCEYDS